MFKPSLDTVQCNPTVHCDSRTADFSLWRKVTPVMLTTKYYALNTEWWQTGYRILHAVMFVGAFSGSPQKKLEVKSFVYTMETLPVNFNRYNNFFNTSPTSVLFAKMAASMQKLPPCPVR